ncbi:uncharacterized protein LOC130672942 [Microplitis mediator]|uniref:uncharacterized protein LOC130672942 n=1 Tax=Microplitis mediator TaxID=375433 RepID=UPI00255491CE|nr:uncharacterized protein LOC130672942 [Microplitis mediator]
MWAYSIIMCLIFVSVTCDKNDFSTHSDSTSSSVIHTHMSQLLELCYSNVSNPIAMTPNLIDTVYQNPSNTLTAPIIILDDDFFAKDIQLYYPAYPTYVLSVDTQRQLINLMIKIRDSPLWNTASVFYVIGNTDQSCKNALQMTYTLWLFQCLSSFVICQGNDNRTMLQTLNPFTHRAPYPWVEVKKLNWGLRSAFYEQPFINDKMLCDVLNFDKTQFLHGYKVKVTTLSPVDQFLQKYVFPSLNITPINIYGGQADKRLLANRVHDISATLFSLNSADSKLFDIVPGVLEGEFAIVTQKRSFLSPFNQILSVFDVGDIIAIILILILFIIVIMLSNEYQILPAFMDVFKLLLRMGMDSPVDRLFMKINLFTALLFVFMFGPAIDAQLSAILTRPSSFEIETLQDLHDHRYHIYYHPSVHKTMIRTEIWTTVEDMKYLHPVDEELPDRCFERASMDDTVACIYQIQYVVTGVLKKNLRISKNFVFKTSFVHWTRKDWPLKDRVDQQTFRAIESGFIDKHIHRPIRNTLKKMKAKERLKKILDYDKVDAIDLEYAYIFFAFIQLLAIVIFGIEYIIARWLRPRQ